VIHLKLTPAHSDQLDNASPTGGLGMVMRTGNRDQQAKDPELLDTHAGGRSGDERTTEAELRLIQEEIAALRCELDDRRLLERDLAELATEHPAGDRDELTLPADEAKLVTLVNMADRAVRGSIFGW